MSESRNLEPDKLESWIRIGHCFTSKGSIIFREREPVLHILQKHVLKELVAPLILQILLNFGVIDPSHIIYKKGLTMNNSLNGTCCHHSLKARTL